MNEPEAITALSTLVDSIGTAMENAEALESKVECFVNTLDDSDAEMPLGDTAAVNYLRELVSKAADYLAETYMAAGDLHTELEQVHNAADDVFAGLHDTKGVEGDLLDMARLVHDLDRGLSSMDDLRRAADEVAYYAPTEAVL